MDFLKFLNDTNVYEAKISKSSSRVSVIFEDNVPSLETLTKGFVVINKHNQKVMGNYEEFKYLYKKENESSYILSSVEGDVYVEPKAKVAFNVHEGCSVEGELIQEVYNYEELIIPTIHVEDGYEFVKWTPEVPTEGKVEKNMVFNAILKDKHIYFHCSGGGQLEGEMKQLVEDYSELTVPSPIADEDYKFVGWMPEIPEEGTVETREFYAVFESNIPDRLKFVESDLTDTQLGLVENFDFTMSTAEEVTDLQMALVELYDMFLLQIAE